MTISRKTSAPSRQVISLLFFFLLLHVVSFRIFFPITTNKNSLDFNQKWLFLNFNWIFLILTTTRATEKEYKNRKTEKNATKLHNPRGFWQFRSNKMKRKLHFAFTIQQKLSKLYGHLEMSICRPACLFRWLWHFKISMQKWPLIHNTQFNLMIWNWKCYCCSFVRWTKQKISNEKKNFHFVGFWTQVLFCVCMCVYSWNLCHSTFAKWRNSNA